MQKHDLKNGFGLIEIGITEKIEDLNPEVMGSGSLILQNGNLFKVQSNPIHTTLSSFDAKDDSFITDNIEANIYESDKVYLIQENWAEFKLDKDHIRHVMKYFRDIFNKHGCEAAVMLMVNPTTKKWEVLPVIQLDCSKTEVNYLKPVEDPSHNNDNKLKGYYEAVFEDKNAKRLMQKTFQYYQKLTAEGYVLYGTIHSHCDFSAFHSGIDDSDELNFDGLHITIGNVDADFSFSARYMINQVSFDVELESIIEGITHLDELKKDIDEIKIDKFFMELMMPELGKSSFSVNFGQSSPYGGKAQKIVGYFHGPWGGGDYQPSSYEWNNEKNTNKYDEEREVEAIINEGVLWEEKAQRIYDKKVKKCFWISWNSYCQNREYLNNSRFTVMGDPELPDIDEMDIEGPDPSDELDALWLFSHPALGADKNDRPLVCAGKIEPETSLFSNRKAIKIPFQERKL